MSLSVYERNTESMNEKQNLSKLDLSDRSSIEFGLCKGEDFKTIAKQINRHPASISREIRNNRSFLPGNYPHGNDCKLVRSCTIKGLCGNRECNGYCYICNMHNCHKFCSSYMSSSCHKYENPPYVCNNCENRKICQNDKYFYSAKRAQALSERRRSDGHSGIRIKGEEFDVMNKTISKFVKKGQPLTHICETYRDQIPVCERTVYNYISEGKLNIKGIDLRRQAGYRQRKKSEV